MGNKDWTGFKGKKVYIKTRGNRVYSGIVKDVITQDFSYTFYLIDKFGKAVMLNSDELLEVKEE